MANILVLHGPNLNLLGTREPEIYGRQTLVEIDQVLTQMADTAGHTCRTLQSNSEEGLIHAIQQAPAEHIAFIIINPAAFTHTSVAIRDALLAVPTPMIEVHLSNPHRREAFRRTSYFSDLAIGVISGFGAQSYYFAMTAACQYLAQPIKNLR